MQGCVCLYKGKNKKIKEARSNKKKPLALVNFFVIHITAAYRIYAQNYACPLEFSHAYGRTFWLWTCWRTQERAAGAGVRGKKWRREYKGEMKHCIKKNWVGRTFFEEGGLQPGGSWLFWWFKERENIQTSITTTIIIPITITSLHSYTLHLHVTSVKQ